MNTTVTEIATGIYRLSTHAEEMDFTFNQFLVDADEPLLFHTGPRGMFPLVSDAFARVMPLERLRWISYGHFESDECGSVNQWLAAAPNAQVVQGNIGVMVSMDDAADRPPRALADGEALDLGGKRVRWIDTPQVPHGWDAGLLFEETTATLFSGDLGSHSGNPAPLVDTDIVGPANADEDMFHSTALTPSTGPAIRRLAALEPTTLAIMHGSSYGGDCAQALRDIAGLYDYRLDAALAESRAGV